MDVQQSTLAAGWQRAWNHYNGNPPRPLRTRAGEPNDNVLLSFARLIVDKGVSFLFGQPVTSEVLDASGGVQSWLDECWRRNRRALTLQKLAINGGVTGTAFAKLVPGLPYPRLVVLDTQTVDVVWADDDCDAVQQYVITHQTSDSDGTRQMIAMQDDCSWQISEQQMDSTTGGDWLTISTMTWPYPFCPIVSCQNLPAPNDFWGISDLTPEVLHVLETINRIASHYAKVIRVHAYPKTWSRGMGNKTIRIGIDEVINLPSETAELHNLEMASDLSSTAALLDRLLDYLSFITRTPKVALGAPDQEGALSGVAMQLRYAPLIEKTNTKRLSYGDLLQTVDSCFLAMGGLGEGLRTQLHWPDLLPSDPLQQRQSLVLDDSLGVSTETILTKLGYDPTLEAERRAAERLANTPPQLVPPPLAPQAPLPAVAKA